MVALGHPLRRRRGTSICTLRIARQVWLADGAAIGAAGEERAEDEHLSTFSCHSCHVV